MCIRDRGYNDKAKKYKVSEWFDVWMKLYKIGRIKANTVRGYVDGFERGADFIGSVRLDCLTPSHIYNMVEGDVYKRQGLCRRNFYGKHRSKGEV